MITRKDWQAGNVQTKSGRDFGEIFEIVNTGEFVVVHSGSMFQPRWEANGVNIQGYLSKAPDPSIDLIIKKD